MFKNIGEKIKILAVVLFVLDIVFCVIWGIVLIALDEDYIAIGILMLVLGPIFALITSWLLYGFAEIIDNTTYTEYNTRTILEYFDANFDKADNDYLNQEAEYSKVNDGLKDTTEEDLKKLKSFLDLGLITEDAYNHAVSNVLR